MYKVLALTTTTIPQIVLLIRNVALVWISLLNGVRSCSHYHYLAFVIFRLHYQTSAQNEIMENKQQSKSTWVVLVWYSINFIQSRDNLFCWEQQANNIVSVCNFTRRNWGGSSPKPQFS